MVQFGLRLHDAEKLPLPQLLPLVKNKGFCCVHLALSKALKEYPCTPSALTPGYANYLRHLFEKNELDIAVIGNYLNLANPDEEYMKNAESVNLNCLTTIPLGKRATIYSKNISLRLSSKRT